MFIKISLMSFIYDMIDSFNFPVKIVREIYSQKKLRCFPCHISTDTDSTALMFIFICEVRCLLR